MSFPSFTAGDVLTATDMNAVGLWKITETIVTAGSTSSISFNNCFTSSYANYRINIDQFVPSTASIGPNLRMRVGGVDNTTTNYNWSFVGLYEDNTSTNAANTGQTSANLGIFNSTNTLFLGSATVDMFSPALAIRTHMQLNSILYNAKFGGRTGYAVHNVETAYDGFTIFVTSGNISQIRVRVYGYK